MEWTIPIQHFDIGKTIVHSPTRASKLLSCLSYEDGHVQLHTLSILLPLLLVKAYDSSTGRLQISLEGDQAKMTMLKLQQFQDMVIQSVSVNQKRWFPGEKASDKEDIRRGFQPFVEHGTLHLYCPPSTSSIVNEIHTYSDKTWNKGAVSPSLFITGKSIRLAIKIQGLSFHQHPLTKAWTGKFRLQHRITAILTT